MGTGFEVQGFTFGQDYLACVHNKKRKKGMTKDNAYLPILMLKEGKETSVNDAPYSVNENQLKPKKDYSVWVTRLKCCLTIDV